ncbi:DUF202 domain-containing protein [Nocardioides sp. BGMRC 2183]|nr:DUF202 domain-containing protein [Nocardioides sp. BGMRC 2183]
MSLTGTDPGLQIERTALAWRRTALSTAALGLLLVRLGFSHDQPLEVAAGAGALLIAAGFAARSIRHRHT